MTVPMEWKVLADSVPGLLAYLDTDRRLLIANERCREWLGCESENLRGRPIEELLAEMGCAEPALQIEPASIGQSCVFDAELTTPAGPRKTRISLVPHLDPPFKPKGYTAILLDSLDKGHRETVGRRRETEPVRARKSEAISALLRECEGIFASIGSNADQGMGLIDSRHPLAVKLREIRLAQERGSSLNRRLLEATGEPSPVADSARAISSPFAEGHATGGPMVLLAEDEDSVRKLIIRILQNGGYRVLEAASGTEALKVAAAYAGEIDLLLTDVMMAGMGGRELAQHLLPLRSEMQILYMSGFTDDTVLRIGLRANGIAFLAKPFTPAALLKKVRETLAETGKFR